MARFVTEKKEGNSFFAQNLACVTGGLVGCNVRSCRAKTGERVKKGENAMHFVSIRHNRHHIEDKMTPKWL